MKFPSDIAIVTGAAKRIGRSIALALAREGCDIVVHYGRSEREARETADEINALGRKAVCVSADLADPELAAKTIVERCQNELGCPRFLVNSAAIFDRGLLSDTSSSNWTSHLAVNLTAPFHLMQEFVAAGSIGDHDAENEPSRHVVNIVDWRAHEHPTGHLAYTVSKTGLLALTRMTAQELAPHVRVNAIAPGPMLPPPGKDESYIQPVIDKLPMQRKGSPDDIADAVVWLCEADFVTGTLLHVDGGQQFSGGMA